jgi:class 3 adenylate cyclase
MQADGPFKGGDARLWDLIEARTRPGADVARIDGIDERIWDLFGQEWAVMFTDLAGFSRQVAAFGITHFLQIIYEHKQLLLPLAAAHDGVLVKAWADSLILLFRRPTAAVRCAIAMQQACAQVNQRRLPEEQILLCVGIGYGPLLRIGEDDVFGVEVNAASRLGEDTANAYDILLTEAAMLAAGKLAGLGFDDLGQAVPGSDRNYRLVYDRP